MKYILGGGITGLIFAHYNQDYTVITENIGGQMGSSFTLGPRYLHKTQNSKAFLYSLGLKYSERTATVGYIDDSGWVNEPDVEFRKKYFMKSRGKFDLEGFDPTVMNSNRSRFEVLDVDFQKLITRLDDKMLNRIKQGKVSRIDTVNKVIQVERGKYTDQLEYDHLVSTLPLKIFPWILEGDHEIKARKYEAFSMTYCLVDNDDEFDTSSFDFVYDARSSTKWHRMTKDKDGVVLDFFGELDKTELKAHVNSRYQDHKMLPNCQIVSQDKEPHMKDIKFVGRYGTWNRSWKTEKVIDEAIAWQERQSKNN